MPFNLFKNVTPAAKALLSQLDDNFTAVAIVVTNLTALRAVPKPGSATGSTGTAITLGATTAGDGLGGFYWYDSTDTTSADNGSTIIVATDGGRWKLASTLTNVTTQGVTNNGTSPASTAFVRQMGVQRRAVSSRTGAVTLTTSDLGALQIWAGTTGATLTLPAASAFPAGTGIEFVGSGASMATGTISRAGADTIVDGEATGLTSIAITVPGHQFWLVSDGTSVWRYVGPRRMYRSAFTATLPAASTQVTFTHGLGITPSNAWLEAECTTADNGYAVGDRIFPETAVAGFMLQPGMARNSTVVTVSTANGTAWMKAPKAGGANVALTLASWKYRLIAEV